MDELTVEDFADCDTLVHLASVGVSPQRASWEELLRWNVLATVHVCQTALAAGVRRIVVAGSYAEYGRTALRYDFIPPDATLEPVNPYAASKAAAFALCFALAVEAQCEFVYARIFSAFGEGQHAGNFWPMLRAAARNGVSFPMTLGEQVRDFIAVEDVARSLCDAAATFPVRIDQPFVYNLASGRPVRLVDFAREWWERFGAQGSLLPGAVPYRANEIMRFVPQL